MSDEFDDIVRERFHRTASALHVTPYTAHAPYTGPISAPVRRRPLLAAAVAAVLIALVALVANRPGPGPEVAAGPPTCESASGASDPSGFSLSGESWELRVQQRDVGRTLELLVDGKWASGNAGTAQLPDGSPDPNAYAWTVALTDSGTYVYGDAPSAATQIVVTSTTGRTQRICTTPLPALERTVFAARVTLDGLAEFAAVNTAEAAVAQLDVRSRGYTGGRGNSSHAFTVRVAPSDN